MRRREPGLLGLPRVDEVVKRHRPAVERLALRQHAMLSTVHGVGAVREDLGARARLAVHHVREALAVLCETVLCQTAMGERGGP